VNALRNRINFLELEETKLLSKIEETKSKAFDVIRIKRDARVHSELVQNAKVHEVQSIEHRKEDVSTMKNDLTEGLHQAYVYAKNDH